MAWYTSEKPSAFLFLIKKILKIFLCQPAVLNTDMNKTNISTSLGAIFTWYDFIIFNIAIALIFPKLFFPDMGYLIPILVFAIGMLARPIGGILFGIIGDLLGRKITLVATLYVTGISTVIIGLLPTYSEIGIASTILLIIARVFQTAAVGGEWAAASSMLVEHNATNKKKSFITSFVNSGFGIANVLAALMFFLIFLKGETFVIDGGWRIPFLLSGLLLIVGVYIRNKVLETPEFLSNKNNKLIQSTPLRTTVINYYKPIVTAALVISLAASWAYVVMVFGVSYMIQKELITRSEVMQTQFLSWCVISMTLIFFGWLSDKVDKTKLLIFGAVCSLVLTWPVFLLIGSGNAILAMLSLTLLISPAMAVAPALFCELFPSTIRQTGVGISYNLGLIISGLMTVVAQQTLNLTQDLMSVAVVFIVLTFLSLASSLYLRKIIVK